MIYVRSVMGMALLRRREEALFGVLEKIEIKEREKYIPNINIQNETYFQMLHHLCYNTWPHNTRVIHKKILKLLIIWDFRFLVVVMKSFIFWDTKLCTLLKINKCSENHGWQHVPPKHQLIFN
jgi:hypothetical protein